MNRFFRGMLTALLTVPMMLTSSGASAAQSRLSTDKTVYEEGEDILVTAYGEGKDWVGIYARGETPGSPASIYWYYVAGDAEPGDAVNIKTTRSNNRAEYNDLPGGAYTVFLLLNDGYTVAESVDIVILPSKEERLTVASETLYEGDVPSVTVYGSGSEWVGLYREGEDPKTAQPLASFVLAAQKSGTKISLGPKESLSVGNYVVWLFSDEGRAAEPLASAGFAVSEAKTPDAPAGLTYRADAAADGYAAGTVTLVPAAQGTAAEDFYLFWGKGGEPLEGYTFLARAHGSTEPLEITLPKYLTIPEGAEEILACGENRFGRSPWQTVPLPEGARAYGAGEVLLRFQVTSDWHVTDNPKHEHNLHVGMMLDDIASVCPDSAAIIGVGDIADHGRESEYKRVGEIIAARENVPPIHYVIGNHDVSMNLGYKKQIEIFNEFAGNDSAYYDLWIGGYHFIFLAFETEGAPQAIPKKELTWLEEKLAEDADPKKPIFVFCHESILDTVAGSTSEEGWWGISNGEKVAELFSRYPQTVFFNGHSHWELCSYNEMFAGDAKRTFSAFNTSSVGYLWTGYNIVPGEYLYGSEGLFVEVCENALLVRGRDFVKNEWTAAAQYTVPGAWEESEAAPEETEPAPDDEAPVVTPGGEEPAQTSPETEAPAQASPENGESAERTGGCASVIGSGAVFVVPAVCAAAVLTRRRKE